MGRFLLYGGFGGPKPYEAQVLEVTLAALDERDAEALAAQVKLIERMQRQVTKLHTADPGISRTIDEEEHGPPV